MGTRVGPSFVAAIILILLLPMVSVAADTSGTSPAWQRSSDDTREIQLMMRALLPDTEVTGCSSLPMITITPQVARTVSIRFAAEWRQGYDFSRHAVIEINGVEKHKWVFTHSTDQTFQDTIDTTISNTIKAYTIYARDDDKQSRYYGHLYVDGALVASSDDAGPLTPLVHVIPSSGPSPRDAWLWIFVKDAQTQNSIPGATVYFDGKPMPQTDTEGKSRCSYVVSSPPETHSWRVEKSGYKMQQGTVLIENFESGGGLPVYLEREASPSYPPNLTLYQPQVNGLTVTINGVVTPGTAGATVTRILWNWGDGQSGDYWFPASHTYGSGGTYTITVTAYQSDGQSTSRSVTATVSGGQQNQDVKFRGTGVGGTSDRIDYEVRIEEILGDPTGILRVGAKAWVDVWFSRLIIGGPIGTGDKVEVHGELYNFDANQPGVHVSKDYHYLKKVAPSCVEGDVKVLVMCPDGKTWEHRQVCRNNAWMDEYQNCPKCSGGAVQNVVMCPDGVNWKQREVCRNNNWVPEQKPCQVCSEGAVRNEVKCPDGVNWKQREVCRNNNWVPEQQTCQVCSEGAVKVLETCPDGTTWKRRQVCRNNAWTEESQQCTPPACGAKIVQIERPNQEYTAGDTVPLAVGIKNTGTAPQVYFVELTIEGPQTTGTSYQVSTLSPAIASGETAKPRLEWKVLKDAFAGSYSLVARVYDYDVWAGTRGAVCHSDSELFAFAVDQGYSYAETYHWWPFDRVGVHFHISKQDMGSPVFSGLSTRTYIWVSRGLEAASIIISPKVPDLPFGWAKALSGAIDLNDEFLLAKDVGQAVVYGDDGADWVLVQIAGPLVFFYGTTFVEMKKVVHWPDPGTLTLSFQVSQVPVPAWWAMSFPDSGHAVQLDEPPGQHRLYLRVYDDNGRQIGFDRSTREVELQIPGGYYTDLGGRTIIVLPVSVSSYRYVVDATSSENTSEKYMVTVSVMANYMQSSQVTDSGAIAQGEKIEHSVLISNSKVYVDAPWWAPIWDEYGLIFSGLILLVAVAGIVLRTKIGRRKASSRQTVPSVKEIRSAVGRPRVKSIQETGTKPRVLKIEDE